jgi:hypothetical protein
LAVQTRTQAKREQVLRQKEDQQTQDTGNQLTPIEDQLNLEDTGEDSNQEVD